MRAGRWQSWLRNPFVWGLAIIVAGVLVGSVTLAAAVRYDGPSDITCSRDFGGKQSWVSCTDTAAGAAAAGALLGDTSDVTVRSDALLWASRVAFTPAAALAVWMVFAAVRALAIGGPGSVRRARRDARRRRAQRVRQRGGES